MTSKVWGVLLVALALNVQAELKALNDADLSAQSGQGGVYLSGEFSINKDGGVLWDTPASVNRASWTANERSCHAPGATATESCGMRLAIRSEAAGGWYVLDNLKGTFSFEGLTLRTRLINSGFGGDGASFNQDVIELGLPNEVKYKNGSFAFAVANQGGWRNNQAGAPAADTTYQQTNIFSAKLEGTIRMQGNVLIFPKN